MNYRYEIDGLRAIAVITVLLFHTNYPVFASGFVGIDIFFIISGYLITGLILQSNEVGDFSLVAFYGRRARRLLPALLFMLLVCIPFAWMWMFSSQFKDFSQSLISSIFFGSNFLFWLESQKYFAESSSLKPLLHTWSLSLEEQFYLVYPIVLLLLLSRVRKCLFLYITIITIAFGVYSFVYIKDQLVAHYLPQSRVWLFGIGTMAYFARSKWSTEKSPYAVTLASVGLFILVLAITLPNFEFLELTKVETRSLTVYLSVISSAVLLLFADSSNFVGQALSNRVASKIGLMSYSLYLWHYPIFVFARLRFPMVNELGYALLILVSLLFAFFSWLYIEKPFRNVGGPSYRLFTPLVLCSMVFIGLVGGYGVLKDGQVYGMGEKEQALSINWGLGPDCQFKDGKPLCKTIDQPEILVWGDSFAMHSVGLLSPIDGSSSIVQLTKSACSPLVNRSTRLTSNDSKLNKKRHEFRKLCLDFNDGVLAFLDDMPSLQYVVIASRFSNMFKGYNQKAKSIEAREFAIQKAYDGLSDVLQLIENKGLTPIVIAEPRRPPENKIYCAAHALKFDYKGSDCSYPSRPGASFLMVNEFLTRIGKSHKVLWLDEYLCPDQTCKTIDDGIELYTLGGHLSERGAARIGSKLGIYEKIIQTK